MIELHIPDGYLDLRIALLMWALSISVVGFSLKKVSEKKESNAMIGVISAAIFASQMLNWPIPGGTSAHFVGGALAGILLGPYAGCIAMTSVLAVQALIYGDGGIFSLGANIWNMAVVSVFVGWYIYKALERFSKNLGSFFAGWLSITLSASFVGIEIGLSTAFKYSVFVATSVMAFWHGLLGIIEGIITAGVVGYVFSHRAESEEKLSKKAVTLIALLIFLSPLFAYLAEIVGYAEPLENLAVHLNLKDTQTYNGLFPGYTIPGMNSYLGTFLSGAVGVVIFLSLAYMRKYASAD